MRRLLIATHGQMASGVKNALEMFVGADYDVTAINAYINDEDDIDEIMNQYIKSIEPDQEVVIFTDLFGGSVNQLVLRTLLKKIPNNVFLITHLNLAIVISVLLYHGELSNDVIDQLIIESQVERIVLEVNVSDENEDDFFE